MGGGPGGGGGGRVGGRRVVEERAASLGAPAAWLGRDFQLEHRPEPGGGSRIRFREGELEIEAPLAAAGAHQAHNAALALACLLRAGHPAERIRQVAPGALASVVLPGRAELLRREPPVLVDSAHTEASARALAEVLRRVPRRRAHLVLSISAGKDVPAILAELLPCFERLTITRAEPTRSLEPQQIAAAARGVASDLELQVVPNPHLALRAAAESQAEGELLCVTGSVYLAGIARRLLRDAAETAGRVQVSRRPPPRLVPR